MPKLKLQFGHAFLPCLRFLFKQILWKTWPHRVNSIFDFGVCKNFSKHMLQVAFRNFPTKDSFSLVMHDNSWESWYFKHFSQLMFPLLKPASFRSSLSPASYASLKFRVANLVLTPNSWINSEIASSFQGQNFIIYFSNLYKVFLLLFGRNRSLVKVLVLKLFGSQTMWICMPCTQQCYVT